MKVRVGIAAFCIFAMFGWQGMTQGHPDVNPDSSGIVLSPELRRMMLDRPKGRTEVNPEFSGVVLSLEMRRLMLEKLSSDNTVGSNLCDQNYGDICTKINVFCVKSDPVTDVDRLNGVIARKSVGARIIFKENGKYDFGLRRFYYERNKNGLEIRLVGDAYAPNCSGISDE